MKCIECGLRFKGLCGDCENFGGAEWCQANRSDKCSTCKIIDKCDEGMCPLYDSVQYCVANARNAWHRFLWDNWSEIIKPKPAISNKAFGLDDKTKLGKVRTINWHIAKGWIEAARMAKVL